MESLDTHMFTFYSVVNVHLGCTCALSDLSAAGWVLRGHLPEGVFVPSSRHNGNLPLAFDGRFNTEHGILKEPGQEMPTAGGMPLP